VAAKFRGIFPPTVTLFRDDGSLDSDGNRRHVDFLIEQGVQGLYVLGTTGEFMHLILREREQHATEIVQHVNKRVPVIVGTGTTSTRETIRLSRHAEGVGADAIAIITPYFWTLSEREVVAHLSAVANAVDIPIVVYNFPAYCGVNIASETMAALVREHRNIVGVKDSVDSLALLHERVQLVKAVNEEFSVLAGHDAHLLNVLQLGGDGTVPATANFAPQRHVALYRAFEAGDIERALALLPDLLACLDVFRIPGSFQSLVKESMGLAGLADVVSARQPALPLSADSRARLRDTLDRAGLLPAKVEA
jgi:4-hydroxy-tetrahydrodipicolinate synthase